MSFHAVIMAGGTGGHIYPALAVAARLLARGVTVSWLGTRRGLESRLVPSNNIDIDYIDIEGVRGKGPASLLKAPLLITRATLQARAAIKARKANIVLGFGGFVAGPGGVAARLCGLPLFIHEQNAIAGTTNKLLAKIASRVFTAFPNVFAGARVVGNPVRAEICALAPPQQRLAAADGVVPKPINLVVLGGSLGASALNEIIPAALAILSPTARAAITVLHQCGEKNLAATRAAYESAGVAIDDHVVRVDAFVEDMAAVYGTAHFVICRAGALTVAELSAAGCASLLVPFPHAIDDHQTHNAMWLVNEQAAEICQQKDLDVRQLAHRLEQVLTDWPQVLKMAQNARKLAKTEAAEILSNQCFEVLGYEH